MQEFTQKATIAIANGYEAFKLGLFDDAEQAARKAIIADPSRPEAHFLIGLLAIEGKDLRTAIAAFGSVTKLNPADRAAWSHLAALLQRLGHFDRADAAVSRALQGGATDAETADLIGTVLTQFGRHLEALAWHRKAHEAKPERADFAINFASSALFLGRSNDAESALNRFVGDDGIPQAEWLYSTIRKAQGRSRADQLSARAQRASSAPAKAFLAYAAGKEYEDCELWAEAFAAFQAGAGAKRSVVEFDEDKEIALFASLQTTFTEEWFGRPASGCTAEAPIFIVGQPRTGTTLVERIIASHSAVDSAGELQQFGIALRRLGGSAEGARHDVGAWARADPRALGEAYFSETAPMRGAGLRFIDKLPRNFLFLPLIAKALPAAKIVHLTRDPLDACFASYKQLFADAYLHSYDQAEMARHYCRYFRLMAHWRSMLPGAFLDVSYERLVCDTEAETRRLIEYLQLPWEDACLRFHELDAPVATASAAQVREIAHRRSVGRAGLYGDHLQPMKQILAIDGLLKAVVAPSEP